MATISQLSVEFGIKTSEFTAGIRKIQRDVAELEKQAKPIKKLMDEMGQASTKAGKVLTAGLTLPITAIGALGIQFNAMQESATTAFTQMLGSAQAAGSYLNELKNFAAKTPFEFPDLVKAAQRMMAMGFATKEVLPTLQSVGDAVAGMGGGAAEIDRVTLALGQMQGRGKVATQEMNQLTEVGIPAWQMLADKMGIAQSELRDMVEKGAVPAGRAIEQLVESMNEKFGGMTEKQSKSFVGLLSTIKDEARFIAGELTEGVFNAIKGPAQSMANALHSLREQLEGMSDWAKTTITGIGLFAAGIGPALFIFGTLAGSVSNIIGLYATLSKVLPAAKLALAGFTSGVTLGSLAIGGVWTVAIGTGLVALYKLYDAFEQHKEAHKNLAKATVELTVSTDRATKSLRDYGMEVNTVGMNEKQRVEYLAQLAHSIALKTKAQEEATKADADAAREMFGWGENIKSVGEYLKEWVKKQTEAQKKFKEAQDAAYKAAYDAGQQALQDTKEAFDAASDYHAKKLIERYDKYIDHLKDMKKAFDAAQVSVNKALDEGNEYFRDQLKKNSDKYLDALDKEIKAKDKQLEDIRKMEDHNAEYLQKKHEDAFKAIHDSAGKAWDAAYKRGKNVLDNLGDLFSAWGQTLGRSVFQQFTAVLFTPLKKAFDDFFTSLLESSGIKSFITGLGDRIGKMLSGIGGDSIGGKQPRSPGAFWGSPETIAIGSVIGAAVAWMKSQAHHEASRFVREFQDPFANAQGTGQINKIVDAFAKAFGTGSLTYEAAVEAKAQVIDLWETFKRKTAEFAKQGSDEAVVAQQALNTLTPLINQILSDMTGGIDAIAAATEATRRSEEETKRAADEMEAAAKAAEEAVDALAKATEELNDAIARRIEIDEELVDIQEALTNAFNSKIDNFEDAIGRSVNAIDRAKDSIADIGNAIDRSFQTIEESMLEIIDIGEDIEESFHKIAELMGSIDEINEEIVMLQSQLEDAAHWQDIYTEAIADAEESYARAADRRKSLEERIANEIADLNFKIRKDELQHIIDNSADAKQVALANQQMAELEKARVRNENQQRLQQIENLKKELAEAIRLENAAKLAIAERQRATQADIEEQQQAIRESIAQKEEEREELYKRIKAEEDAIKAMENTRDELYLRIKAEEKAIKAMEAARDELYLLIGAEEERILLLEEEKNKTLALMESLGIERTNENTKIDDTIQKLQLRQAALQAEATALDAIIARGIALTDIANKVPATTPLPEPPPGSTGKLTGVPDTGRHHDQVIRGVRIGPTDYDLTIGSFLQGAVQHQLEAAGLWLPDDFPIVNREILNRVMSLGLPTYAQGTPYVPYDQIAMLHRGEAVVPADRNMGGFSVNVYVAGDGDAHKIRTVIENMMPELTKQLTRRTVSSGDRLISSGSRSRR